MKPFMGVICTIMLYILYRTTNYQYLQTELDSKLFRFVPRNLCQLPQA
ncbi:hypothetical protein Ccrd_010333 [Cynara cardunculus var. scolymus]|uniref:Uncharacterized protein n=1 Tax=Cynara cardunculus var. scolymus TaxID=59895 RepID=A0A103YLG0_CYNCS|nr:hypothetical protein Ccrd_010333 [Cynara cardunculus var. scolymus]